jgi:hypothetical protein
MLLLTDYRRRRCRGTRRARTGWPRLRRGHVQLGYAYRFGKPLARCGGALARRDDRPDGSRVTMVGRDVRPRGALRGARRADVRRRSRT